VTTEPATQLTKGATGPERTFGPLTRATFVRYAAASGDLNPLHYDEEFARSVGYPSVFSHGMHQAALMATYLTDWFGAESVRRFKVRFRDQVWPGDVLTCSGTVDEVQRDGDVTRVVLSLTARRQTGAIVISGSAEVEVPPDGVTTSTQGRNESCSATAQSIQSANQMQ
jgi:acyl dehydratase